MLEKPDLARLLAPFLGVGPVPDQLYSKLQTYLGLLQRWNARTNLTAIRSPEEMVTRHFGESLFAGRVLERFGVAQGTLLDFGSGAGFPGLPIQLLFPDMRVTLAESQGKKSAFLREVVRSLALEVEIWAGRVEDLPMERKFGTVAMRAVDGMSRMEPFARTRLSESGTFLQFTSAAAREPGTRSFLLPGRQDSYVTLESATVFHVERSEQQV